ncbi:MAG TPA: 23S rRNA (uracil(1939)-C(5))-methyltransferase RlmD [Salinivirgaceae bacterium]|nr:23S rRNA (uracil(1939)-C(5))-methyltransferase RlmD [Salinivirgaceae bacterium]
MQNVVLENVEIVDMAAEGNAIARVEGRVVFVPWVAPGDVVDIQITRRKHNYAEGRAINFHRKSPFREEPFCKHFGTCGGCRWQHLSYEKQLAFKQQQVIDAMQRIGKVDFPTPQPIAGAENIKYYRNKLEFTFSDSRWILPDEPYIENRSDREALGFHIPGRFDKVLDIKECFLQHPLSNQIRLAVKDYCLKNGLSFQNIRNHQGKMRNLIIRNSNTGEWMVIVVFGKEASRDQQEKLLQFIHNQFPEITSLWFVVNSKVNDSISDLEPKLFYGKEYLVEKMMHLEYHIGPKSFYQTNSQQAQILYRVVYDFSQLTGSELVFDLYTGTGTIANMLALNAKRVYGIEYIEEAIIDARKNSMMNGVQNTIFIAGDMKDILTEEFIHQHGVPDVLVTDPPRSGMHPDVVLTILKANPKRIVYVSCNPATQARDVAILDAKYRIAGMQTVDMFPHTHHVENVLLLEHK